VIHSLSPVALKSVNCPLASPTRGSRSNTSETMGKIKWGDKPPTRRKETTVGSSRLPANCKKITDRLSADTPTSTRLETLKKQKNEGYTTNKDFDSDHQKMVRFSLYKFMFDDADFYFQFFFTLIFFSNLVSRGTQNTSYNCLY
jgi:hypothetical protein